MYMRFTWDAKKKAANPGKHRGVTFEMGVEVFEDPNAVILENYFVDGEQRMQAIGMSKNLLLLLVVFVDRSDRDEIAIHIISARRATAYEKSTYNDQFR
jgi:uncharacterized DUF497 family protein